MFLSFNFNVLLSLLLLELVVVASPTMGGKVLLIPSPVGGSHSMHMAQLANMIAQDTKHEVLFLRNNLHETRIEPSPRVKEIVVKDDVGKELADKIMSGGSKDPMWGRWNVSADFEILETMFEATCRGMMSRDDVWREIAAKGIDLVIIDEFPSCLFLAVERYLPSASTIHYSTSGLIAGSAWVLGVPYYPSYTTVMINILGADLNNPTFINRAKNLVGYVVETLMFGYKFNYRTSMRLAEELWGDSTSLDVYSAVHKSSLIMVHSDFAYHEPRPLLPNVVLVGAIMCREPQALSKEFEKDMNVPGSQGVIYVAMGTYVSYDMIGRATVDLLLDAFTQLTEFTVLFKLDLVPEWRKIPGHIKLRKWMPQQDILGHKRTKVFLSHGGLNSMFETIYHAVPVLVIPVYGDQDANADTMVATGMGRRLDKNNLHPEDISSALRDLATNRYKEAAVERSSILRDHPQTPRQRFIYWIEYGLRHGGKKNPLRVNTRDLNVIQHYNLDILFILLAVPLLLVHLVVWKCCCNRSKRSHVKVD